MQRNRRNNKMGKTRDIFKKIRDTKGTFRARMGSIKDSTPFTHPVSPISNIHDTSTVHWVQYAAQYCDQNIGIDTVEIQTSPLSQVALFYHFITTPTSHLPVPLHQFLAITNLFFILTISIFQECHINEIIYMWTFVIDFFFHSA